MIGSQKQLAVQLSRLKVFTSPDARKEQYPTDGEIAARVLWHSHMQGEIEEQTIADLGAGTGILGLGALLLGAQKVHFVENDALANQVLKENIQSLKIHPSKYELHELDIQEFTMPVDLVVQNPPFGTRQTHADLAFLDKAAELAPTAYSFHKTATLLYLRGWIERKGLRITDEMPFDFPLKQTLIHHKRRIARIQVTCLRIDRVPLLQ